MKPTLKALIQFAELNSLQLASFDTVLRYYNMTVEYGVEGCGCLLPASIRFSDELAALNNLPF